MKRIPDRAETTDCTGHVANLLRSRASSLQHQARQLSEPLATTYRRRARELELEAYLLERTPAAQHR